nr:MAG TPA: Cyclin-dependent kinase 9 [Caudoviricetes sp.]
MVVNNDTIVIPSRLQGLLGNYDVCYIFIQQRLSM